MALQLVVRNHETHLLEKVCSRDFVQFALIDNFDRNFFTSEYMTSELDHGEMTAAQCLLQVVEASDFAIVIAETYSPMHFVSESTEENWNEITEILT